MRALLLRLFAAPRVQAVAAGDATRKTPRLLQVLDEFDRKANLSPF